MFIRWRERSDYGNIVEDDHAEENLLVEEAHVVDDDDYLGGPIDRSSLAS